jgi:carbamoyltransferase
MAQSESARFIPEYLYSVPNYMIYTSNNTPNSLTLKIKYKKNDLTIHYLDHHLCHIAFPYFTSDFNNAMILSMDGWGEKVSTLLATATMGNFYNCWEIEFPQSLGMFYQTMTEYLGFQPQSDEWKVMGASSYGNKKKYKEKILKLIWPTNDGKFQMDLSYFDYMSFTKRNLFSKKLIEFLGPNRFPNAELKRKHFDIAAAVQDVFEDIVFSILNKNYNGEYKNLCISGGSAMNCVANGKIINNTPYQQLNVSFAPDDSGTCIGACLLLWNLLTKSNQRSVFMSPYLAKKYSNDEIESYLRNYKINFTKTKNPAEKAAKYIANGKIIGWFQGRMEFGQRALGNRSILADPRKKEMKDMINRIVKYRESFRPFAPAILDEFGKEYFRDYEFTPYMEKVLYFKKNMREKIPAVCHIDGTGRLQSVSKETNPLFWTLINEFRKITGIPLILNTSFNLNGEPIVHSVSDALRTFYSCGLDILIIGDYIVKK